MAKANATQTGVLETESDVVGTPNPRNDFIEQLANQNHEVIKAELAEAGLIEQTSTDTEAPAAEPAATHNATPQLLSENDLANMRVKAKVDGIEEERSIADILKTYQKDSAASKRLEQAAARQAELDQREAELAIREQALTNLNAAKPASTDNLSVSDDAVGQVVTALYDGDEEKTKQALKELFAQRPPAIATQPIDPAVIAEQVRQRIKTDEAMQNFGATFTEIVADPVLAQVADTYLAKELQDGVELNEALTKAGNATREWIKAKTPVVNPQANTDRVVRKSELDNVPAASLKSGNPETPIDGENVASDAIKEMRKARGLPV